MGLRRKQVKEEPEVFNLTPDYSDEIDVRISVSKEFREHYSKVIEQRDMILENPLSENQAITSILGATTTIIKELSKIQESLYNSEKYAIFQQIVISTIKDLDPEAAAIIEQHLGDLYFED